MASLAQYSHALHSAPRAEHVRTTPGCGARWFGFAIYAGTGVLVVLAALASS